jgi:hypothetical protein
MIKPHLIVSSAHMEISDRISEYIDSFKIINDLKEFFESTTIVETISQNKLDYLENSGLDTYYSNLGNPESNKGHNWVRHMTNYLHQSKINDNDIIISMTGRYLIVNKNILSLIEKHIISDNNEFIAKQDNDIYIGECHGVHTFYMAFTKSKFLDFSNWFEINGRQTCCIEWDVKKYLDSHDNCLILPKETIMGIETKIFHLDGHNNKIC